MPARVIGNNNGDSKNKVAKSPKVMVKAPILDETHQEKIAQEMEAVLAQKSAPSSAQSKVQQNTKEFNNMDRAQFYAGHDRLNLRGECVQRVRELQEENDHLQREIVAKESEIINCKDPLAILADIEHRRIIVARNTGEILKIYLRNEERMKRVKELEAHNNRIQNEMMEMQGQFIKTKDMDDKTRFASEFFILRSEIERNLEEINELNKK